MSEKFKDGGIVEGKLHSECTITEGCGEKFDVGGTPIEVERDEAIIVPRAFMIPGQFEITGTPKQIASALNVMGGGKSFASGAKMKDSKGNEVKISKRVHGNTDVSAIEPGSIVINRKSMYDKNIYTVKGTTRQIASAINSLKGNGVKIESGASMTDHKTGKTKKMAQGGEVCDVSTEIQTLMFEKNLFTESAAKGWAKSHDFRYGKVDETDNYFRLRQNDPVEYENDSFRTIDITTGIKAVIGCPTSKKEDGGYAGKPANYMAENQVKTIERAARELKEGIENQEGELPDWHKSLITKAEDVVVTANEYLKSDQGKMEQGGEVFKTGKKHTGVLGKHFNYSGLGVMSRGEFVETILEKGYRPELKWMLGKKQRGAVFDTKEEAEKYAKNTYSGLKPSKRYRLATPDGTGYDVTKKEFDYAIELLKEKGVSGEGSEKPKNEPKQSLKAKIKYHENPFGDKTRIRIDAELSNGKKRSMGILYPTPLHPEPIAPDEAIEMFRKNLEESFGTTVEIDGLPDVSREAREEPAKDSEPTGYKTKVERYPSGYYFVRVIHGGLNRLMGDEFQDESSAKRFAEKLAKTNNGEFLGIDTSPYEAGINRGTNYSTTKLDVESSTQIPRSLKEGAKAIRIPKQKADGRIDPSDNKMLELVSRGIRGNDDLRPNFSYVYFLDKYVGFTDAHKMMVLPLSRKSRGAIDFGFSKEGKNVRKGQEASEAWFVSNDADESKVISHPFYRVLPNYSNEHYQGVLDVKELYRYCEFLASNKLIHNATKMVVFQYRDYISNDKSKIGANCLFIKDVMSSFLTLGIDNVHCYITSNNRGILFTQKRIPKGYETNQSSSIHDSTGGFALVMPVMIEHDSVIGDVDLGVAFGIIYDLTDNLTYNSKGEEDWYLTPKSLLSEKEFQFSSQKEYRKTFNKLFKELDYAKKDILESVVRRTIKDGFGENVTNEKLANALQWMYAWL